MRVWTIPSFGIDNLKLESRPDPTPGPNQVVVAVKAVALNFRDLMMVKGHYNPRLALPRVPCSDAAGDVIAIGPGVTRVAIGDRVCGIFMQRWLAGGVDDSVAKSALGGEIDGVLAEQVLLPEEGVVPYPAHLTPLEASTLPCAAVTAWNALAGAGLRAGETVLIQGTGGVSIFALQIAKMFGARVLVTSSSDEKLAKALAMGASAGLNYRTTPDWDKWARTETGGIGVEHVVEVGGSGTLERSFKAVRTAGHIALIGVLSGVGAVNPIPILMRSLNVRGIFVGSREMFLEMNRAFTLHQIRPAIDKTFAFEEAPAALQYMEKAGHFGKIVVKVAA